MLAERPVSTEPRRTTCSSNSAVGAPFVKYKQAAFLDPESTPVAFSLALVAKDYGLIHELAERVGAPCRRPTPTAPAVAAAVADAGFGEQDMAALATYLRTL